MILNNMVYQWLLVGDGWWWSIIIWLVVDLPLWKIWARQLGLLFPTEWKNKTCSKPPTRYVWSKTLHQKGRRSCCFRLVISAHAIHWTWVPISHRSQSIGIHSQCLGTHYTWSYKQWLLGILGILGIPGIWTRRNQSPKTNQISSFGWLQVFQGSRVTFQTTIAMENHPLQ